jgi:hypothetical protein
MSQQVVSGSLSSPLQLVSERASGPLSIAGSRSAAKWADLLSETDLTSCGGAVRIPVYTSKSQVVHAHGQQSRINHLSSLLLPCLSAVPSCFASASAASSLPLSAQTSDPTEPTPGSTPTGAVVGTGPPGQSYSWSSLPQNSGAPKPTRVWAPPPSMPFDLPHSMCLGKEDAADKEQ